MSDAGALREGTVHAPDYHECDWPPDVQGDVSLQTRLFTYGTTQGIVSGSILSVMFTVDRPVKQVWPYVKDWNLWMNSYGYYWPGVVGDLYRREERDFEKETFRITVKQPGLPSQEFNHYQLLKVLPEHLIVLYEPIQEDGSNGGVSHGMHVFMLTEREGKTVVTISIEHAIRTDDRSANDAIRRWLDYERNPKEAQRFWREVFIPNLKKLVYDNHGLRCAR